MNEELQSALIDVLKSAISAKDFILAELPEVVNQLLMWKMYESLAHVTLGVLLLIVVWFVAPKTVAMCVDDPDASDFSDKYSPSLMINLFWIVPIIIGLDLLNITWLQILVAPKVYLIEYATKLTG